MAKSLSTRIFQVERQMQHLEQRCDEAIANLRAARAESVALREQFSQSRSRAEEINFAILELRGRLEIKQGVIRLLLPFYPHPITPELRWQIDC